MSRSKKILTDNEKEYRQKSADRVKALKESWNTSYKGLAVRLGLAESTVRNYAHKRTTMNSLVARVFQNHTGIIWLYWIGESDCTTWDEYNAIQEAAADDGLSQYFEEEQRQIEQYEAIFSLCGFEYKRLSGAEYEFDINTEGQHRIKDSTTGITATLDDSELQALVDRLRSTIQLECFIKSKQA